MLYHDDKTTISGMVGYGRGLPPNHTAALSFGPPCPSKTAKSSESAETSGVGNVMMY